MKIWLLFLVSVVGTTSSLSLYADSKDDLSKNVLKWVKEGKGRIIYELELMRADSIVYEIKIDAQTGEWLEEEVEH